MRTRRRRGTSRTLRLLWGGLALLFLLAIVGSTLLARREVTRQEQDAQARAEKNVNEVVSSALTPELVSKPILGPEYRDLTITLQSGVFSDERVARIRIWRPDGTLVYSSDQRDHIGEFVAKDDPQITMATAGRTVSLVTPATVVSKPGLAGSAERLYETFVPLRLADGSGVSGVGQIDQRYSTIEEPATRVWQPVQIGLLAALLVVIVLFSFSLRARPAGADAEALADLRPASAHDDAELLAKFRKAQERAEAAELTARAAQARLEAERSVRAGEASAAGSADVVDQLAARLRAADAEREQLGGELRRLRAALAEREGELAIAREATESRSAEASRATDAAATDAKRLADLQARSQEAEQRALGAEQRTRVAEQQAAALEAQLRTAVAARGALESVSKTTTGDEKKKGAELRQARLELNDLRGKLTEAETALRDIREEGAQKDSSIAALRADHQQAMSDLDSVRATLLQREDELEGELKELRSLMRDKDVQLGAAAETARAHEVATSKGAEAQVAELETARSSLAEAESRVAELEAARVALEEQLGSPDGHTPAAGSATDGAAAGTSEVAELEARLRELESLHRNDVEELQRAREALGNTQVELTRSTKRARRLEARVKELDGAPAAPPTPEPADEWVPDPPYVSRPAERPREPEPEADSEAGRQPGDSDGDEMLSLRERLARAAAARHRPSGGSDED